MNHICMKHSFPATFALCFLLISGCTSADTVKQESLSYMQNRYGQTFLVQSIDMQRNEGNWGTARLQMQPEDQPDLLFQLNYNYSNDRVIFENYLIRLWEKQVQIRIHERFSQLRDSSMQLRISRRKSLSANGLELPVDRSLQGMQALGEPTIAIELLNQAGTAAPDYSVISQLFQFLRSMGFRKISLRLEYGQKGARGKLLAQWYGSHNTPGVQDLKPLFRGPNEPSLSSITEGDFKRASELLKDGMIQKALPVFEEIVRTNDSPYRYNPYVVAQSGNVYESAYEAGRILMQQGQKDRALFYFNLLEDRLSYEEVPLKYASFLREIERM